MFVSRDLLKISVQLDKEYNKMTSKSHGMDVLVCVEYPPQWLTWIQSMVNTRPLKGVGDVGGFTPHRFTTDKCRMRRIVGRATFRR
jgi:hypothetical protein